MQQVNLYRTELTSRPILLGWRSLLILAGCAIAAMTGISAYGQLQLQTLQAQADASEQQLKALRQGLERLNQGLAAARNDPYRQAERERLRRLAVEAQHFLQALNRLSQPDSEGFSPYFRGLARRPVSGLWLEELQIEGQALTLRGQALDPGLIPRFLQGLRGESVFDGHVFADVQFERQDSAEQPAVRFELRSLAAEASGERDG